MVGRYAVSRVKNPESITTDRFLSLGIDGDVEMMAKIPYAGAKAGQLKEVASVFRTRA